MSASFTGDGAARGTPPACTQAAGGGQARGQSRCLAGLQAAAALAGVARLSLLQTPRAKRGISLSGVPPTSWARSPTQRAHWLLSDEGWAAANDGRAGVLALQAANARRG